MRIEKISAPSAANRSALILCLFLVVRDGRARRSERSRRRAAEGASVGHRKIHPRKSIVLENRWVQWDVPTIAKTCWAQFEIYPKRRRLARSAQPSAR